MHASWGLNNNVKIRNEAPGSWKNEPYVWMIIAIPLSAVIVGFIMLALAIESDTGLVIDDYYKRGKEINRVLARDNLARSMGLKAGLKLDPVLGQMQVTLESIDTTLPVEEISISFFHATRQGLDQTRLLHRIEGNHYRAGLTELPPGRWDVQIATKSWRLLGSLPVPGPDEIRLLPIIE